MISNAANMTVAEKLAQKLKTSELGALMDEDTITQVAQEALRIAFFTPRDVAEGYNRKTLPPLAAEYAIESFKEQIREALKPVIETMTESDDFKMLLRDAVIKSIPEAAKEIGYGIVNRAMNDTGSIIMTRLQNTVGSKLGIQL